LFFKLQGATPNTLSESVDVIKEIVKKHSGDNIWPASTQEELELRQMLRLWGLWTTSWTMMRKQRPRADIPTSPQAM